MSPGISPSITLSRSLTDILVAAPKLSLRAATRVSTIRGSRVGGSGRPPPVSLDTSPGWKPDTREASFVRGPPGIGDPLLLLPGDPYPPPLLLLPRLAS